MKRYGLQRSPTGGTVALMASPDGAYVEHKEAVAVIATLLEVLYCLPVTAMMPAHVARAIRIGSEALRTNGPVLWGESTERPETAETTLDLRVQFPRGDYGRRELSARYWISDLETQSDPRYANRLLLRVAMDELAGRLDQMVAAEQKPKGGKEGA